MTFSKLAFIQAGLLTLAVCVPVGGQESGNPFDGAFFGGESSVSNPAVVPDDDDSDNDEIWSMKLRIVDAGGRPIPGAEVATEPCYGKGDLAEGVNEPIFESARTKRANEDGWVTIRYFRRNNDDWTILSVAVVAKHPDFARSEMQFFDAAKKTNELVLRTAFKIAIKAVDESGNPLADNLHVLCSQAGGDAWVQHSNGLLVSPKYLAEPTSLRVVRVAAGQPTLFSKEIKLDPQLKKRVVLTNVKLLQGVKLTGKLSDSVPRPVKEQMEVSVVSPLGASGFWSDKTTVAEDGTFVIESLPRNSVAQVHVKGDHWISMQPDENAVAAAYPSEANSHASKMWMPQIYMLEHEGFDATIPMQATERVQINLHDKAGAPLEDIVIKSSLAKKIFGSKHHLPETPTRDLLLGVLSGDDIFPVHFESTTDDSGVAELGLPPGMNHGFYLNGLSFKKMVEQKGKLSIQLDHAMQQEVLVRFGG